MLLVVQPSGHVHDVFFSFLPLHKVKIHYTKKIKRENCVFYSSAEVNHPTLT